MLMAEHSLIAVHVEMIQHRWNLCPMAQTEQLSTSRLGTS
jgi:hypothetical protein